MFMKLIKLNPKTPGTRHTIKLQKNLLLKNNSFFKNITVYKHKFAGRSSIYGRITSNHQENGCKKLFRLVDFTNEKKVSIVLAISYDPNRTSFISLNFDLESKRFFAALATLNLFSGSIYVCNTSLNDLKHGFKTIIQKIPAGSIISNLSLKKNSVVKYARSAGTSCQLIQKGTNFSKVRLPSGKILDVENDSFATLGINSNLQQNQIYLGKAGTNRLKGYRPKVRGIAMNPVDHPHGGRANSGFVYKTPWGIPTQGVKTKKINK